MRTLVRIVVRNPFAVILGAAFITFVGMYAALHMPTGLFPDLEVPVVNIITHYPGAAPEDMELLISRPIEGEVRTIPGVRRVASVSAQGISRVTVEFGWGTGVNDARQTVQAKLARVRSILPVGVSPRLENIGTTLQEVAGYVVYGGHDPITLRTIVRHDVAARLIGVDGVSSVDVIGGDRRAFFVRIKPEVLARLHLSVNDIATALRRNNRTVVAGYVDWSSREYLIRGDARLETLDDLRSIPIVARGERSVLLGSVAQVSEGRAPKHYVVRGNGIPAVAFVVRKQPGKSAVRVVHEVAATIAELQGSLLAGTHVEKFYDQSEIIVEARSEIVRDLFIGALLAVMVLYFFLGSLRPTLVVAGTIPVSLLAALAVMGLLGLSLNVITMTALALAIGMIVDDAIVVAENIERHRLTGLNTTDASIEGTAEIAGADASGTFTTVAAFLPLILVSGLAALFLKPFALTVSAALLASLVLSLTIVPLLVSRGAPVSGRADFSGARLLGLVNRKVQHTLAISFRHRWLTLCLTLLFLTLAGLTALLGKGSLLPPIDEGAILIEYTMPPGTALSESNRIGVGLDSVALADPDVSCVYRRAGSPENGYQIEGVNRGEMMIKLKPKSERGRSANQITAALRAAYSKLPGMVFLYHQPTQEKIDESFSGLPAVFGVTVYGTDVDTLAAVGTRVEALLKEDPAVGNVVNNTNMKASQIGVRVDYAKLAQYRVKAENVLATLRAARLGVEATRIVRQREQIAVLVKMSGERIPDLARIRGLPIVTDSGGIVPLERIADVRIFRAPASVTRLNGQREITLLADVSGNILSVASRLRRGFRSLRLPADYSIAISGQYTTLIKTAYEMLFVLFSAVVLIYLIMAMQFRSWFQPLIILATVPLSLVGALIALFITRQGLNVSVGMGAITLVGVSVNNAIVLLDYANGSVASGEELGDALLSAASVRLRPILLTALTTIFALIPAAIGTTVGSKIFQPFAITVIGGLLSGAVATLLVVPTFAMAASRFSFSAPSPHKEG